MNQKRNKVGSTTPNIGGRPTLAKAAPVVLSPEYLEAITVLSEASMAQACAWLLSEQDYNNNKSATDNNTDDKPKEDEKNKNDETKDDDTKKDTKNKEEKKTIIGSDHQKLLDFYAKCSQAVEVVKKQKGSTQVLPPSIPVIPQVRGVGAGSVGAAPHRGRKPGEPPLRTRPTAGALSARAAMLKSKTAMAGNKRGSLGGTSTGEKNVAAETASKKARAMMPPPPPQPASAPAEGGGGGDTNAPPPSALSFLAKLNKDSNKETTTSTAASASSGGSSDAKSEASSASSSTPATATATSAAATTTAAAAAPAPPTEAGRRNPPRGAAPR